LTPRWTLDHFLPMPPVIDRRCTLTDIRASSVKVPRLVAVVTWGDGASASAPLGITPITIGTAPDAGVVVVDDRVSRHHCRLSLGEQGVRLEDLGSKNGTFVGGAAILAVMIPPGVEVTLGNARLVIRVEGQPEEVPLFNAARFGGALGGSLVMRALFARLERAALSDEAILLLGESGTGKEILARSIHDRSMRKDGPFVVFDCSAVAPNLAEDELFGHVKGAFTGAQGARAGVFEQAEGGTLFIDEIGELPLELQPKLLRALESRQVRRLGAEAKHAVAFDCRVVAATHRDVRAQLEAGQFRQDLYYRLHVLEVSIPPLRDRREDIPLLVERFLAAQVPPRRLADLPPNAMEMLVAHDWPGNVRELRNAVTRLVVFADTASLAQPSAPGDRRMSALVGLPLREARSAVIEAFEREYLTAQLRKAKGSVIRAAEAMDVTRQMVYKLMDRYGIEHENSGRPR
jgi:DNA-binding NtrC family response regulator